MHWRFSRPGKGCAIWARVLPRSSHVLSWPDTNPRGTWSEFQRWCSKKRPHFVCDSASSAALHLSLKKPTLTRPPLPTLRYLQMLALSTRSLPRPSRSHIEAREATAGTSCATSVFWASAPARTCSCCCFSSWWINCEFSPTFEPTCRMPGKSVTACRPRGPRAESS